MNLTNFGLDVFLCEGSYLPPGFLVDYLAPIDGLKPSSRVAVPLHR
jgi:hypothetical protein